MRLIINFDNGSDNDEKQDCVLIINKSLMYGLNRAIH